MEERRREEGVKRCQGERHCSLCAFKKTSLERAGCCSCTIVATIISQRYLILMQRRGGWISKHLICTGEDDFAPSRIFRMRIS